MDKRNEVQKTLKNVLDDINETYHTEIAARFLITLGDEFQGLLFNAKSVLKIIEEIKMRMHPVEVRFGIGIGRITTDINAEMALGADGPAYYCARNAIEVLKENEKRNRNVPSDIRVEAEQNHFENQIILLNTVFELMTSIEQGWTERQRTIIWDMQKHQDGQSNAAKRLGIAQSSVNKALISGKYYLYTRSMKNAELTLGELIL